MINKKLLVEKLTIFTFSNIRSLNTTIGKAWVDCSLRNGDTYTYPAANRVPSPCSWIDMRSRYNVCLWDVAGATRRWTSDSLGLRADQVNSWRTLFLLQYSQVFCSSFSWRCRDLGEVSKWFPPTQWRRYPFQWEPHSDPLSKSLVSFCPSLGYTFQSGHSILSYLRVSAKHKQMLTASMRKHVTFRPIPAFTTYVPIR